MTLASSGLAVVHIEGQSTGLRDFEARAKAAPTAAQLKAAKAIHGRVSWSSLGAPASVIHYGGYLATGIKASSAAAAARSWLAAHKQVFRLRSVSHSGQASYHGDQDQDPNNNADCNASIRANEVHVAEVQVFGQNPTVDGTKVTTG